MGAPEIVDGRKNGKVSELSLDTLTLNEFVSIGSSFKYLKQHDMQHNIHDLYDQVKSLVEKVAPSEGSVKSTKPKLSALFRHT